jgi:hypothetical protein
VGAGGLREPRRKGARVAAPSGCIVPWAARASCWPQPQQLLPVSAAGSGRRCCCSNPPLRPFCETDKNRNSSTRFGYWSSWWARVDYASRASKKAPQGLFSPPDCSAGRCCSNPPLRSFCTADKTETPVPGSDTGVFGGRGWIRTTEAESSRFTVCPHWPLGNTPIFICCTSLRRTTCLF